MRSENINSSAAGAWLVEWPSRLRAMADLICFPGAGMGASIFLPWRVELPAFAAVHICQLPARENRIDITAVASLGAAADAVTASYLATNSRVRPLVLFGHSMGGVLAFETTRRLEKKGRQPYAVVISASTPTSESGVNADLDLHAIGELLIAYDPGKQTLISNEELFASLASTLRDDLLMLRRHSVKPRSTRLATCAYLLSGDADRMVPKELVARWAAYFRGPVFHRSFTGGHFFPVRESQADVVTFLANLLHESIKDRVAKTRQTR